MNELTGENWLIKIGDVRETAKSIESNLVHAALTSIPYWGQRDYGYPFQIGLEKTPQLFVETIVGVFREVKRILRPDGVLFINVGDTRKNRKPVGIPSLVRDGLIADGWHYRSEIVWFKPTAMPETVAGWRWKRHQIKTKERTPEGKPIYLDCPGCDKCRDNGGLILRKNQWRPSNAHEFLYMFSKSESYFADGDGSKEPVTGGAHSRGKGLNPKAAAVDVTNGRANMPKANNSFSVNCTELVEVRNLRSVWRIVATGYKGAHFATFPLELVKRSLSAAISPGGCCSTCGVQLAPIVITDRQPTRPARNVKEWKADNADPLGQRSEGSPNRDPKRHITKQAILDYKACCACGAATTRPVVRGSDANRPGCYQHGGQVHRA